MRYAAVMTDIALEPGRPSPDALLAAAGTARPLGGRLKIFLGAAPGVGKTYEMLEAAHAKQREGVDVVVGVAETHGRTETAALLGGLEAIPLRQVEYRDQTLTEMDLDALLRRGPRLAIVDELAHTNAPGSRHPKRHLDVEELLAAGIDVYTTLNIQHVESLNDVVARITRVRVRETVPDAVLDRADDIEVVDIAPEDLIQRLNEGKVYLPAQAERALRSYFSVGNLTALRELALRRTAQRVDEQLRSHMAAHAIAGPWPASERLLVCVSDDPRSAGLVRYAKRMADRLDAPWTAIHVETARGQQLTGAARDRIAATLRLAETLGGEAMTLPGGTRIADEVVAFAHASNVTHVLIGKSQRSRWFELLHGSVVRDLIRMAGPISLHIVAGDAIVADEPGPQTKALRTRTRSGPYLVAGVAVTAATGFGQLAVPFLGIEAIDLVYMFGIVGVAAAFGLGPSLLASVASSLFYNFFFLPPRYTFTIADPTNVAALAFFLLVAVVVSNLAARVRSQVITARARARTTEALYSFSKKIAATATLDDLLWASASQVASMLKVDVVILLREAGTLTVKIGYPPEDRIDDADVGAAKWAFESNQAAGRGASTLPGAKRLFLPLRTTRGAVGVVGITREGADLLLGPDDRRLLDALLGQIAVAIERIGLASEMDTARLASETERLRSALLTSLSHDLKTPLAAILGAATALREFGKSYAPEARDELVETIEAEAERLNRFVGNLLDMTRLESGPIALRSEPVDLAEIVATALRRTASQLQSRSVRVELSPDLPMLRLDPVLFEQVLVNLLDNAAKFAPPGSTVTVHGRGNGRILLSVADQGPGIPPEELERVFEKFYRVPERDRRRVGTGLGLAICRGFVEAMGGTIVAANRTDGPGTVMTVAFPTTLIVDQSKAAELPGCRSSWSTTSRRFSGCSAPA